MNQDAYADFQKEWQERFALDGIKNYFLDGPLTQDYWTASPRIAVLNLEAYGYLDKGMVRLSFDLIEGEWIRPPKDERPSKTAIFTSSFVAVLQDTLKTERAVSRETLKTCFGDAERRLNAMKKIAYLNIRKTPNGTSSQNVAEIRKACAGYGLELLQKQFSLLDPEIIIVSGNEACRAANVIFNFEETLQFHGNAITKDGAEVVSTKHFSRPNYSHQACTIEGVAKRRLMGQR